MSERRYSREALKRERGGVIAGAVLILLGIAFLAQQFIEGFGDSAILFLIGGAFIAGYFYYRGAYGLLIPGGILVGIAFGSVGENTILGIGDFSQIGLGLGFVAIYLIDLIYRGTTSWWPLIPGGILIVTGVGKASVTVQRLLSIGWPLILVLVGLVILASTLGLTRKGDGDSPEPR